MTATTDGVDLLVPAAYDVVWSLVVVAHVVLLVAALVQWSRARAARAPQGDGLLDVLVIVLVPVLGPAAYLIGRRRAPDADRRTAARPTGD